MLLLIQDVLRVALIPAEATGYRLKLAVPVTGFSVYDPPPCDYDMSEVDVGGGEIVDALVVATVVVIGDEGFDVGFEITREVVVFQ